MSPSLTISPNTKITNRFLVPPSKSHSIRAIFFASLAKGISFIHNYLNSPDILLMIKAMQEFGANIQIHHNYLVITGVNGLPKSPQNIINSGNSGQVFRFCTALAALLPTYTIITGDNSIKTGRPIKPLLYSLEKLGAFAKTSHPSFNSPIIIKGPITPGITELSGEDSQPVSALLMTTPFLRGETIINVVNPKELPWINFTISWLKSLNHIIHYKDFSSFRVKGNFSCNSFTVKIPGDFSSATFLIITALIKKNSLVLHNLNPSDFQGDKDIIFTLQKMGANIEIIKEKNIIEILPSPTLEGGEIDADKFIDSVPILAVLGCFCKKKLIIFNAKSAQNKESSRLTAISCELKKMNAKIVQTNDGLIIYPSFLTGNLHLDSHNDHRIAMALAIASLKASTPSIIHNVACIKKSFPNFLNFFI